MEKFVAVELPKCEVIEVAHYLTPDLDGQGGCHGGNDEVRLFELRLRLKRPQDQF